MKQNYFFPEVITMQNDPVNVAVRGFQQKLDSFKTKIEFQQLLAESPAAEFESLTSGFENKLLTLNKTDIIYITN
jgi:hypothetical protein